MRLKKGLYGLKQTSHEFYKLLPKKLIAYGFDECLTDTGIVRKLDLRIRSKEKIFLLSVSMLVA